MDWMEMMPVLSGPWSLERAPGAIQAQVEQYVAAYRVEAPALSALLPEGFSSLRPVLRINIERLEKVEWLAERSLCRVELNTPVAYGERKGWLNLVTWENDMDSILAGRDIRGVAAVYAAIRQTNQPQGVRFALCGSEGVFLDIGFTRTGQQGGCPHEADNQGTFSVRPVRWPQQGRQVLFRPVEQIAQPKEFCQCSFTWRTPPRLVEPVWHDLLHRIESVRCQEVLGAYVVSFERTAAGALPSCLS